MRSFGEAGNDPTARLPRGQVRRLRSAGDDLRASLRLDDGSVDELDPATREFLGAQWGTRAAAELRVASIFAVLARELFETGAEPPVLRICARAISDEVRHAEICRLLAERYSGHEVAWPAPGPVPMPLHERAPELLRPTLRAVAIGCISETIASSWLEASMKGATAPIARAAVRQLLADEVQHARLGWAHLASSRVTQPMRSELATWVPRLFQAAALPWLTIEHDREEGVPTHGVPSAATSREAVVSALREIILPGFDALGVATGPAHAWLNERGI